MVRINLPSEKNENSGNLNVNFRAAVAEEEGMTVMAVAVDRISWASCQVFQAAAAMYVDII